MKTNDINKYKKKLLIPIKVIENLEENKYQKPSWLKIKLPANSANIQRIKSLMRKNDLYSVCEEASCPNLPECFNSGTAAFMILGNICTRKCPFCDVEHGRPNILNPNEPEKLANTIKQMKLKYVVITSVNRDDLHDGGATHFSNCIKAIRKININIKIEILVPDFRNCMDNAINIISNIPPDIFNHNLENVPRMYNKIRPGANYHRSLNLLKYFKNKNPNIPTKSGLMLGLGETNHEIIEVMHNLHSVGVSMLTIGQYLQPSKYHLPVKKYIHPKEFSKIKLQALKIGFINVAAGPFVRSSYHADLQSRGIEF